jgi:hypothetical protein
LILHQSTVAAVTLYAAKIKAKVRKYSCRYDECAVFKCPYRRVDNHLPLSCDAV